MNYGVKVGDGRSDIRYIKDVTKIMFSNKYEMFKTFIEKIMEVPNFGTLNITHNLLYTPVFLIYTKSNFTVNYKMLSVAARFLTGLRTATTTSITSVQDTSGIGARESFVNILEDPISLS
jgi:hypothetical protein